MYPLIGHSCRSDDLLHIQQPVDREILHILGLNEHFPRAALRPNGRVVISFTQPGETTHVRLLELDPTALTRPTALSAFPPAAHSVSDLKSEISDTLPDSSPRRSAPLAFCIAPLAALPP